MNTQVWLVLIAAVVGPMALNWQQGRQRAREKKEDWRRDDEVAKRVELARIQAAEAADLLAHQQEEIKAATGETARLLEQNDERVANATSSTLKRLDVIHTLVNSAMTRALESERDAKEGQLVALLELVDLKEKTGLEPTKDTLATIVELRKKIAELNRTLADRYAQDEIAKAQTQDKMEVIVEARLPQDTRPEHPPTTPP